MITFKYFESPENFAFLADENESCDLCGKTTDCFDASSFLGEEEIDCICDSCLASGALIDMDICANDIDFETVEEAITDEDEFDRLTNEIIYQTPKLPTWQDCYWPFADGDFATFIKIASKLD